MILYIPEGHGCAYSIDSEGAMYYTPLLEGGTLYLEETAEVECENLYGGCYEPELQEIQDKLIAMNKSAGFYFKN
jgi:hypothetical protein